MKLRYILFSVLVCLFLLTIDVSAQTAGIGCETNSGGNLTGKRAGIYYTDCFPKSNPNSNDWARLQGAINTIIASAGPSNTGSGKLVFNEGSYQIDKPLTLNSNMILEGTGVNTSSNPTSVSSLIILTASNQSAFLIPESVTEVSIRDMGLLATSNIGTSGIEGVNQNDNTSSAKFQFSNLRITGFERGIYIHTLNNSDKFQFDSVRLDHASFINCGTAIEIYASDSGWAMTNVNIVSQPNQNGIVITKGGYISMNLIVGNGSLSPSSGTFIKILKASNVSIQNSVTENYLMGLDINSIVQEAKLVPIALVNNYLTDAVSINNATVVSTGNHYGNFTKVALPVIKGQSDVFSIGDTFCWRYGPGKQFCAESKFKLEGNAATLQQMGGVDDSSDPAEDKPALKIIKPANNKTLLALGTHDGNGGEAIYQLKRDQYGRLNFVSLQPDPWKGYNFDGPIRLKSYTFAGLSSMNGIVASGDMVYCSNCSVASSGACQQVSTGGGALAIFTNSQWKCK